MINAAEGMKVALDKLTSGVQRLEHAGARFQRDEAVFIASITVAMHADCWGRSVHLALQANETEILKHHHDGT